MPPAWKIRRELHRLAEICWMLAGLAYEPVLRHFHDRRRRRWPVPPDEAVPLQDKVAIFLLYQPRGVAGSVLRTLRHLVDAGYAPLVVSNAPLSQADRHLLAGCSWRIVERPNWGYDFGGYRDGLLLLQDWGLSPGRVLVLNDSVWFPLGPGSTLLRRLEGQPGDVVGGLMHPGRRRKLTGRMRPAFVESYLYLFNRSALDHPAFRAYWQRLLPSSNKLNAVYRGERGLSARLDRAGLSVTGLFSAERLVSDLRQAGPEAIRLALAHAVYTEADLEREGAALLAAAASADAGWVEAALDHIRRTSARRRFSSSFPHPAIGLMGMDFIKKTAGPVGADGAALNTRMRRQYLRAVAAGDLPRPWPEVLAEIEARTPQGPGQ